MGIGDVCIGLAKDEAIEELATMIESLSRNVLEHPELPLPEMRPRLSDILFSPRERGFDTFAVVNTNVRATESVMRFAAGINPFVAIIGPSGWGKSHLLEAAARRWGQDRTRGPIVLMSALEWLADGRMRAFNGPLILDNVQDLTMRTRSRLQLTLALERRYRAGRPTLLSFTESKITRTIKRSIPFERNWVMAMLKSPTDQERFAILDAMARNERIQLSSVLRNVLAKELHGNGRTMQGALNRLGLTQHDWLDARSTLLACGVLNPFFTANPSWDLRELIADAAQKMPAADRGSVAPFDLAIFTMLKVASLNEGDVARFFRIEQSKAFAYATRFAEKVESNPGTGEVAARFIDRVVASF